MRSNPPRISSRQSKRQRIFEAEQLEPRRLLSYTLSTLSALNSSQLSDPVGALVQDANGDVFFLATAGSSASDNEAVCEAAKGSSTPTALVTVNTGAGSLGGLAIDSAGDLFGLQNTGGAQGEGFVWEIVADSNAITNLGSFNTNTTGSAPFIGSNLAVDSSGNVFGTCQVGGSNDGGTVWEIAKGSGTITALASFQKSVSNDNVGGLTLAGNGNLYGIIGRDISITGDYGAVWELPKSSSTINILASCDGIDGNGPGNPLYIDSQGNVFGESNAGGAGVSGTPNVGDGDIFEIPVGTNTINVLASFTGDNGKGPRSGIVVDSAGDIFGAAGGGSTNQGVIYELPKNSSTIVALSTFGGVAMGGIGSCTIAIDSSGDLIGATTNAGPGGGGVIFQLTPGGSTGGGGGGGSSNLSGALTGKIPPSVIAGQKVNLSPHLAITDTSTSAVTGNVTAKLFLSTSKSVDSNSIQLASTNKAVKLKAHAHIQVSFKVPTLPATVPNGTYYLVAEITDPSGNTVDAPSATTIAVEPPEISLSGAFAKTPVPGKNGKTSMTFTVSDAGNITAAGNLAFNIESSPDGLLADATQVTTSSKKINIRAGKSMRITTSLVLPEGAYFVVIQLDPSNAFHEASLSGTVFKTATALTVGLPL